MQANQTSALNASRDDANRTTTPDTTEKVKCWYYAGRYAKSEYSPTKIFIHKHTSASLERESIGNSSKSDIPVKLKHKGKLKETFSKAEWIGNTWTGLATF